MNPEEDESRAAAGPIDDEAIRALLGRLARPHRSGGKVIERATLLAEGADFGAVMTWIESHGGKPEELTAPRVKRGLHSPRLASTGQVDRTPLRFVLPAAALR